jgi:hypothetical protein
MGQPVNSPQAQLNNPVTDSVQLFLNELRSGVGIEQGERDFSMQSAVGPGQPEAGFVPPPMASCVRANILFTRSIRSEILASRRVERARVLSMVRGEMPRIFDHLSTGCFSSEVSEVSSRSGSPRRTFWIEARLFSVMCQL